MPEAMQFARQRFGVLHACAALQRLASKEPMVERNENLRARALECCTPKRFTPLNNQYGLF